MERRTFMMSLGAALAAVPFLPKSSEALSGKVQALSSAVQGATDERKLWRRVRKEFLLNPDLVHLNCGSLGSSPRLVVDAVSQYMYELEGDPMNNEWGGLGSGMEAVRALAGEFIGAEKNEMVLTRNTTEGMNAVAAGLGLKAGDEVLTSNHEHGGGMVCWQHLARHNGIKVRYLKMPNPVRNKEEILELVEKHVTRKTRVCSFSHLDTITGLQMPLADIAAITRPKDILLVCDGAQAPGQVDVDVKALKVDTYASSSHKWMLAPKGSGLLFIRKEIQERVQPSMLYSGYQVYSGSMGTRNVAQILGHGVAMDFHNAIGRDRVEARCRQLSRLVRERLRQIPALTLLTPDQPELSSGMVSFALDEKKGRNGEIVNRLYKEHNIVGKPAQGTYAYAPEKDVPRENYNALRFSTHIYNNEDQVNRTADILEDMLT